MSLQHHNTTQRKHIVINYKTINVTEHNHRLVVKQH